MEDVNYSNKQTPNLLLEACIETIEDALKAQRHGANRIELCTNLEVGGLTPLKKEIAEAVEKLSIPVMVMVRPRSGNFIFSDDEMKAMIDTIEFCKKAGVAGVVFGNLNSENEIETEQVRLLAHHAAPLEVTFHKAIDETPNLVKSVKQLNQIKGVHRILTSGGADTALNGAHRIREMIKAADGLKIIAAGKVTKENLMGIHHEIGGEEYHGRRIVF